MVRDYRPNHPRWQPAVVLSKTGANSYSVEVRSRMPWRRHADQIVTGSTDSWWRNGDRAEIIDGDHGPEPDVETRTQPGGNSEGHTCVKPSKESREELPETLPELVVAQGPGQVPGQVESSSKGNTNPEAMSEKVTTPITLTDELQRTCPETYKLSPRKSRLPH